MCASGAQSSRAVASSRRPYQRGALAGLLVVALGGAALWWFFGGRGATRPTAAPTDRHNSQIATVAPATNAVAKPPEKPAAPAKPVDPREDYDHELCFRDERGILRYKASPSLHAYDPSRKHHPPRFLNDACRPSPFRHDSEREISAILETTPGERRLLVVNYDDPEFLADFEASLKDHIEISDDDREDEKEMKRAVIEVKKELQERLAKGEKLADILNDARLEMDRLVAYKDDLDSQIATIIKDGDGKFSDQDVLDCVNAANKMLEEKGINPLQPDEFVLSNIRMAAKRLALSQEEADKAEVTAYRQILNGLKSEAKVYLEGNGTWQTYVTELKARQDKEIEIYERTRRELENVTDRKIRDERNAALRAMGLRTIPRPSPH